MNIMDKPTLQEVKEYFKNAKIVDGLISKFDISTCLHTVEYSNKQYWVNDDGSYRVIWDKQLGYTKIISYKEPLYQLTAKEIRYAYENPQWLKDAFKECFETELEVGKWYKNKNIPETLINCQTFNENVKCGYGIHLNLWSESWGLLNYTDYTPATEKEVEEALVKEAIKRGYELGVEVIAPKGTEGIITGNYEHKFRINSNKLYFHNMCVFDNGTWAEFKIYTITEAEEKFNIKIVEKNGK